MLTPTCMCCLHLEISVPGRQFQSLSGFLPGYGRQRGLSLSHLHKQSFDPSNLVIFIQVKKTKRKTNQVEKKTPVSCSRQRNVWKRLLQAAGDEEDTGALGHPP